MVRFSRRQFLLGLPAAASSLALAQAGLERRGGVPTAGGELAISQPFVAGEDRYSCQRTPALAISRLGTVLAFCGGRVDNCKDESNIDVILRRSLEGRRSWALSRDITEQGRLLQGWKRWYGGIGPGHGIVKQREPGAGLIAVPARHGLRGRGSATHLLHSDDGGASSRVGAVAAHSRSSECKVAELANGSLMLNSRSQGGRRVVSLSHDGGLTMASSGPDPTLIEPENGCQANLLSYAFRPDGLITLLFSNPVDVAPRSKGRINVSRDDGRSWQRGYARAPQVVTGYSDLDRFSNGVVALLFESGGQRA